MIAELAGADPARVTGWLTAMSGLGVLHPDPDGRPRYAHPLLRDAVLTGVPAARRRAAHAAAAETMQRHGVSPDTVARQLLLSDPLGAPWTSAALQEAASLALRDGRTADAAAFLRRALEEPLPDARRQRLLTELGSLEYTAQTTSAGIPRLSEALRLSGAPQDTVRAAAATGGRRGLELAEEAVRLLRDGPVGTEAELVSALTVRGRGLTAAGDRGRARACLREAAERAERLGATRQWALAEEALGESGARRTAPARTGRRSLTSSERRIAELAADGRTNTEIADLLHLARRTVESHLTSSYRKLGIRRRGELPRTLGRVSGK